MPSQPSASCFLPVRASRFFVAIATALLLVLPIKLSAQGSVSAHFTAALNQVGTSFDAYAANAVAIDSAGNVYIAGTVSGVAKLFKETNSGGNLTESTILSGVAIQGMAFDPADNLFITSGSNILKIAAGSTNSTVLIANATVGYIPLGLAVDANDNIYIANDGYPRSIDKATLSNGIYTVSTIYTPGGDVKNIALDGTGSFYWTDSNSHIYKETFVPATTTYTHSTFNTTMSTAFYGIAFNKQGDLLTTDANVQGRIYKFTNLGGGAFSSATTILGYGLGYPYQIAQDAAGNIYLPDNGSGRILKVQQASGQFPTTADAAASTTKLSIVFKFDNTGTIGTPSVVAQGGTGLDFTNAGTGTCNTTTTYNAGASCTVDVNFTPKAPGLRTGAVIFKDPSSNALATGLLTGTGVGPLHAFVPGTITTDTQITLGGPIAFPYAIATDTWGNIFVVNGGNCRIEAYSSSLAANGVTAGSACGTEAGGAPLSAVLRNPIAIARSGRGDFYIADGDGHSVLEMDATALAVTRVAGTGTLGTATPGPSTSSALSRPTGIAVDAFGNFYVSDEILKRVMKVDTSGTLSYYAGTGVSGYTGDGSLAINAKLGAVSALAFNPAGDLYIADTSNNVVRMVSTATGIISTVAGNGTAGYSGDGQLATAAQLAGPVGLTFDPAGDLYIADVTNSVVRDVTTDGNIHTLAGVAGTTGSAGDGGPANLAQFFNATGLAFDRSGTGNLYVADYENHVIRVISSSATATFGSFAVNNASPAIDIALTNIGNAPLSVTAITPSANFNVQGIHTSCSSSTALAAGSQCILGIEFLPTTTGSLTGTVTVTDNEPTSTQTVTTSGTGTPQLATKLAVGNILSPFYTGDSIGNLAVYIEDAGGNVVPTSTDTISAIITGPNGYSQSLTDAVAVAGVASFYGASQIMAPGTYTITATSGSLTTDSYTFTVILPPTQMIFTVPSTIVAGGNLGVITVSEENSANAVVSTAVGTVTLAITGPNGFFQQANGTVVNGVATVDLSSFALSPSGTYTVTATTKGITQAPQTLLVTPLATQLASSALPTALAGGGNLGMQIVKLTDGNGNLAIASTAPVTTIITGPNGFTKTVQANASGGIATLDLSSYALPPGTYTISTTSGSLPPVNATVVVGAATQIAVAPLPANVSIGGNLGAAIVTFEDLGGNVATGSSGTVTVTITGPNGYSQQASGAAVNGVVTVNLAGFAFTAVGTYTVTTTSPNLAPVVSMFTVTAATQVGVSGLPASIPPGTALGTLTATLLNANNGVVTGSLPTAVTTTIAGPGGYLQTAGGTTVNGVATLNLGGLPTPTVPGVYTVTTTVNGLPTVTTTFTVAPLPATKIAVTGLPATSVAFGGNLGTVTATLLNASNGVATSGSAVVTATITGPGGFSQVVTGTTVNGVVSLNLSGIALTAPGTYTVTVTSPNLASSVSTITVAAPAPAQPAQLAVTGLASAVGQSSNLGHITASVETATGAVVTTSTAAVTLTITGPGGYSQTVTVAAVAGVAGFDLSGYSFPVLGTYTLTVASAGLPTATYTFIVAQDFTLTPAGASAAGAAPAQTVLPGVPATYALTLAPAGVTFTQPITLSATGLPPGATYSFNPPIVTPGPTAATSTLTITTANTAALRHEHLRNGLGGLALAALLLPFGSRRLRQAARRLSGAGLVAALLGLGALTALSGCGAGGLYGHSPQAYVITVTATSGSFSHSTTVLLTEQ